MKPYKSNKWDKFYSESSSYNSFRLVCFIALYSLAFSYHFALSISLFSRLLLRRRALLVVAFDVSFFLQVRDNCTLLSELRRTFVCAKRISKLQQAIAFTTFFLSFIATRFSFGVSFFVRMLLLLSLLLPFNVLSHTTNLCAFISYDHKMCYVNVDIVLNSSWDPIAT